MCSLSQEGSEHSPEALQFRRQVVAEERVELLHSGLPGKFNSQHLIKVSCKKKENKNGAKKALLNSLRFVLGAPVKCNHAIPGEAQSLRWGREEGMGFRVLWEADFLLIHLLSSISAN